MYYIIECDTNMTVKARFSLCRGVGTYGYIHGYLIDWTPPIFGRYINPVPINWKGRLGFLPINIFDIPMPLPCIQYSVWPKPGFGIGNQNRGLISVSEPKYFFFWNRNFFFQHFLICLKINPYLQRSSKNISNLAANLVFGDLLWRKKYPTLKENYFNIGN